MEEAYVSIHSEFSVKKYYEKENKRRKRLMGIVQLITWFVWGLFMGAGWTVSSNLLTLLAALLHK